MKLKKILKKENNYKIKKKLNIKKLYNINQNIKLKIIIMKNIKIMK